MREEDRKQNKNMDVWHACGDESVRWTRPTMVITISCLGNKESERNKWP